MKKLVKIVLALSISLNAHSESYELPWLDSEEAMKQSKAIAIVKVISANLTESTELGAEYDQVLSNVQVVEPIKGVRASEEFAIVNGAREVGGYYLLLMDSNFSPMWVSNAFTQLLKMEHTNDEMDKDFLNALGLTGNVFLTQLGHYYLPISQSSLDMNFVQDLLNKASKGTQ